MSLPSSVSHVVADRVELYVWLLECGDKMWHWHIRGNYFPLVAKQLKTDCLSSQKGNISLVSELSGKLVWAFRHYVMRRDLLRHTSYKQSLRGCHPHWGCQISRDT